MKSFTKSFFPGLITLLVVIGVGASVSFYFRPAGNKLLYDTPIVTGIHVVLGGIYMAMAPFQFIPTIRRRWINVHRWMGRLLVVVGIIVGITALILALVVPFSGWSERLIVGPFTILFAIAIFNGYRHIRAKRVKEHRAWMVRAFAIGLSISTQRLLFIPPLVYIIVQSGEPPESQLVLLSIITFTLALFIHVIGAEIWIRRRHAQS